MRIWSCPLIGLITGLTTTVFASIIDISSSTLDLTGANTTADTFSSMMSVEAKTTGNILVIGTFSATADSTAGTASWRLSSGAQTSTQISRTLDYRRETGIASVAHIFTGVESGSLINLQHRTSSGNTLTTLGGNLIAIPLTVSTGESLNYGLHQQSGPSQISSTTYQGTGISTTLQLDRASNNGIYMAATFNSQALTGSQAGTWQLQYRRVGDAEWIDTGNPIDRSMSSASDIGSVTLYSLEENLDPGTYEVQLVGKSSEGGTIETLNGTLAAVALSYTNETGGGYFDGFSVTTNALSPVGGPYDGAQLELRLEDSGGIFSCMSLNSSSSAGQNNTGSYDLFLTSSDTTDANQENERFFEDLSDAGSAASAGYFDNLAAGDYSVFGRTDNVVGQINTDNVTLVGFASVAIPEPTTTALIVLFGGSLLVTKRIFDK